MASSVWEGDLRTEVAGMSLTTGVYGAAGHSSVDVKDDDGSRAGTGPDDAGSLGGYMNLTHTSSACGLTLWHRNPPQYESVIGQ